MTRLLFSVVLTAALLAPLAATYGLAVLGVVLAHEYGHAIQERIGALDRSLDRLILGDIGGHQLDLADLGQRLERVRALGIALGKSQGAGQCLIELRDLTDGATGFAFV